MSATFKSLCKWVPHFAVAESLHATIIKDMHFSSSYVLFTLIVIIFICSSLINFFLYLGVARYCGAARLDVYQIFSVYGLVWLLYKIILDLLYKYNLLKIQMQGLN